MDILSIVLKVVLVITSLFLTVLILMHKGQGGGVSEMFGGAMHATVGGSSVAERNLNRYTILIALVWLASIVGLGLITRFAG
ncbi:preprotein translocase subunit SecG [Dermatophilus congolensis]|uniref:Protein-export membrane protein SecG n=1 Tax=Dermatophilus congolensis TaxID=1863 RepID=A0A239VLX5_9MICO|nr:preprotein translocase subunit SecG [Dermatophilus congolensis]MBO3129496.1 preprotein translocase subunit SecG [Dermatophilus congolensis]MBO3131871.1 preprotein translocase subunit SecG [Dermatophilus congolensis]MBO3133972.1 preprotein translocase subunit SecG [Dermatophilus congolensis]MBO3136203.1 preprotein translocase subunit SecG [Dermatophilus congolensis]MBO3138449.1 preprotein translocase subunit SecG [Dermatophilus congolensis]